MNQPFLNRRHKVAPPATVAISPQARFGQQVSIDTTGDITIEAEAHLAHRVTIFTHRHTGHSGPPQPGNFHGELVPCPLVIESYAFIGEGAIILPRCGRIGAWAVIGAGAVVTRPVGPGEIWAGNPARFLRMRDGMTRQTAE